jgi:sialate O-acetylesterase
MHRKVLGSFLLMAASLCALPAPSAELKLHRLFGDGMILQRDIACPVWGSAAPGEEVSVSILGHSRTAKAGADGRWMLKLDPIPAGGPHELKVNQLTIRDVMVGEVWLASGGANMELPVKAALISKTEPDDSPVPMIRFFVVPRRDSEKPLKDVEGVWKSNRSDAVADVSATAYFFARELVHRLRVPVGFIQASVENATGEMWISKETMAATPGLKYLTVPHAINLANFEIAHALYLDSVRKAKEAEERGEKPPPIRPRIPKPMEMSGHYNGMISPLPPFAIRGAVLYGGEMETYRGFVYRNELAAQIRDWRGAWGQGDFPVAFVQMTNRGRREEEISETALPKFREAQTQALEVANTGLVVTVDLSDGTTILPRNKEEVGRRLALWAEHRVYGKTGVVYSGPMFDSLKIEGNKARLIFKNVGGGLKIGGDRLTGFSMASDFRRFFWADARIEGNSVVVTCDDVQWPAAVRYGWADNAGCNLFNQEGLPASPFRTDSW